MSRSFPLPIVYIAYESPKSPIRPQVRPPPEGVFVIIEMPRRGSPSTDSPEQVEIPSAPTVAEIEEAIHEIAIHGGKWEHPSAAINHSYSAIIQAVFHARRATKMSRDQAPTNIEELKRGLACAAIGILDLCAQHHIDLEVEIRGNLNPQRCQGNGLELPRLPVCATIPIPMTRQRRES